MTEGSNFPTIGGNRDPAVYCDEDEEELDMTINEVKNGIIKQLAGLGARVYGEDVRVAELEEGPVIQVDVALVTSRRVCAGKCVERTFLADCAWLNQDTPTNEAMNDAQDSIEAAIVPAIPAGGRMLKPENVRFNKEDSVAHVIFEISLTERIMDENPHAMMGELNLEEHVNGNA